MTAWIDFIVVVFIIMPLTLWIGYHIVSYLTYVAPLYGTPGDLKGLTYREWLKEGNK